MFPCFIVETLNPNIVNYTAEVYMLKKTAQIHHIPNLHHKMGAPSPYKSSAGVSLNEETLPPGGSSTDCWKRLHVD